MATVIDSLVVTLGLDASAFKDGAATVTINLNNVSKAADRTARDMEDSGKRAAEFFEKVRNSALKFFAVFTAGRGLLDFSRETIKTTANLNRLATNLGMSASTISKWGMAVQQAGGEAGEFQGTLQYLSQSLTELKITGQSPILKYLRALGVGVADAAGKARPLDDILLDISDKLVRVAQQNGRADAVNIARGMGLDEGTINLLLKGRVAVQENLRQTERMGAVTDVQARKAQALDEKLTRLRQTLNATARTALLEMGPSLERITELLTQLAAQVAPVAAQLLQMFADLNTATDGWAVKVLALVAALRLLGGTALIGGLLKVAGAITGIGTAASGATAAGAGLMALVSRLSALGGLLYSPELNTGEDEFMRKARESYAAQHGLTPEQTAALAGVRPGQPSAAPARPTAPARTPRQTSPTPAEAARVFGPLEQQYGLPAGLLDSMWLQESGRGRNMVSPAGARGHFQFMPATQREMGLQNPNDLRESADAAARYMSRLLRQTGGNLPEALAAYNGGIGRLQRRGLGGMPAESQDYYRQILSRLPGSVQRLPPTGASARAAASAPMAAPQSSTTSVHVDRVEVYTQATNAVGIARDLGPALIAQSNTGLN